MAHQSGRISASNHLNHTWHARHHKRHPTHTHVHQREATRSCGLRHNLREHRHWQDRASGWQDVSRSIQTNQAQ